ncbi:MAG: hypothetical protein HKP30_09885, partial [Myxococcales bacterium]|nr:hypothetical protein [Myxococcales bacterium]
EEVARRLAVEAEEAAERAAAELEVLQARIERSETAALELREQIASSAQRLEEREAIVTGLRQEIASRDEQLAAGQRELDETREELARFADTEEHLETWQSTRSTLESELATQRQLIDSLRDALDAERTQTKALREEAEQASAERDDLQTRTGELAEAAGRVGMLEAELAEREEKLAARTEENQRARKEIARLLEAETPTGEGESTRAALEAELRSQRESVERLSNDLAAEQAHIAELEADRGAVHERIVGREAQIEALRESLEAREAELDLQVAENERLSAAATSEGERAQEISRLEYELKVAHDEIQDLMAQTGQWQAQIPRLEDELKERYDQVNVLEADLHMSAEEVAVHDREERLLRMRVTALESDLADRDDKIASLESDLDGMHRQLMLQGAAALALPAGAGAGEGATAGEAAVMRTLLERLHRVALELRARVEDAEVARSAARLVRTPGVGLPGNGDEDEPEDASPLDLEAAARVRAALLESLEAILAEERHALRDAGRRAGEREEQAVALEDEVAANRLSLLTLQARLGEGEVPTEERSEAELRRSARLLQAMRVNLSRWQQRIAPLHDAVRARDERIRRLEHELSETRGRVPRGAVDLGDSPDELVAAVNALLADAANLDTAAPVERESVESQHEQVVEMEEELARARHKLREVTDLETQRAAEIERLEATRSSQMVRIAELRERLVAQGLDVDGEPEPDDKAKVIDIDARRS